ncbi:uncharacterized protein LOC115754361 [Rhodamnia argentea]|uniref:Uncharacterized protein LOC115754361 n=1 Tax=Rhodamnia argentea TaxID=178133 RepID=A0A8B8QQA6_9MYRT|nr:uncharacterized protein LOC115754361 [Rhodamnia argentea]
MLFSMKIQPIDCHIEETIRFEPVKPVVKSRLKRLFERQFIGVLKSSTTDKVSGEGGATINKDSFNAEATEFEPSSLCLTKMVQNFMEESNEKQPSSAVRCGRHHCNCFNGSGTDSSEEEESEFPGGGGGRGQWGEFHGELCQTLKSLVMCATLCERNLLADSARIVEKQKMSKRKDESVLKIVSDGLLTLGYDARVCKSRWEKSASFPAGGYEYIDVIIESERLIVDIDFRSEFEIARPTKTYKSVLHALPNIFVGKPERLGKIIAIVSEAAKQSLKSRGMHVAPWRKAEYMEAKWFAPCARSATPTTSNNPHHLLDRKDQSSPGGSGSYEEPLGPSPSELDCSMSLPTESSEDDEGAMAKGKTIATVKLRNSQVGVEIVSGLASVIED